MRASEILRRLADVIDGQQDQTAEVEVDQEPAQDAEDIEDRAQVNVQSMVSPLQQKLELLKKVAGLENAFDMGEINTEYPNPDHYDNEPEQLEDDELDIMRHNAGFPVLVQLAASDNDVED